MEHFYHMKRFSLLFLALLLVSCGVPTIGITQTSDINHPTPISTKQDVSPIDTATTSSSISGKTLIYTPESIYLANADGSSPVLIHTLESPLSMMSLSPDGTKFAYFSGNFLYVKDLIVSKTRTINQDVIGSMGGQLRWSPDGRKIALACSTPSEPTTSLCLIDESGNIEFLVKAQDIASKEAHLGYFIEMQDWSRDGSKLVFTYYTPSEKGQKQDFSVYYYDVFSKATHLILDGKKQKVIFQIREMSVSPDNKNLLISGIGENSLFQIFILNFNTSEIGQIQLRQAPNASLTTPVWGNENCCYYIHVEQDDFSQYTVIADLTGNVRQLVDIQGSVIQWIK